MNDLFDDGVWGFIGAAVLLALIIAVLVFAAVALPFIGLGAVLFGSVYMYYHSDGYKEKKARERTIELYRQVEKIAPPSREQFRDAMMERYDDDVCVAAMVLYEWEGFAAPPAPPPKCNSIDGARYRDQLSNYISKSHHRELFERFERTLTDAFDHLSTGDRGGLFEAKVPLTPERLDAFIEAFFLDETLFAELQKRLNENLKANKGVFPRDYDKPDIAEVYLRNTPLLPLCNLKTTISLGNRFAHHWIVAPPGSGKSTLLQYLLLNDFRDVARGAASVIVMESNRDLIKAIEGLEIFAPGGDLEGRLTLIDCEDVEYPIALNIFDVGLHALQDASPRDREALYNSAVSMLDYVFRALLGAELTSRQSTLFNFAIQLLIAVPGATLDTLIDLMQPGGIENFRDRLPHLDQDTRRFFELKFDADDFRQTKAQVVDRLFAIKRIRTLARMFSAPHTRLNLYEEMGHGRVILINIPRSLLQDEGVEIVGRFFLAQILLAAEKRQLLPRHERLPCYVYIDECQDVIRRDEKLPTILDQARKLNVGMVLAHQRLDQMQPHVLSALFGSTAIKFATRITDSNLARHMHTTPEFIRSQPEFSFAAFVSGSGETDAALSINVPSVDMSRLPRMSRDQMQAMRDDMRARYSAPKLLTYQPEEPEAEHVTADVEEAPQPHGDVDIGATDRL